MCECWGVCVKYDLVGNLSKDQGGLGGLRDVSVHIGHEHWGSRGPQTPPSWRSDTRGLVKTVVQGASRRAISASLPAWKCLGPSTFNAPPVYISLADREASRSVPGGSRFIGALSKTAFCHSIFFRYLNNLDNMIVNKVNNTTTKYSMNNVARVI